MSEFEDHILSELIKINRRLTSLEKEIVTFSKFRSAFEHQLSAKTSWGRNEIKQLIDVSVETAMED